MGWRVRRGVAGDVPFLLGVVALAGAALGALLGVALDVLIHRHRAV